MSAVEKGAPEEPTEQPEPEAEEPGERAEQIARLVLCVVAGLALWGLVVAFPWLAYVAVGMVGTLSWQLGRGWLAKHRGDETTEAVEETPPDIGEALRSLIGDDNGVLLTRLQRHLKVASTKVVKALLEDAGIEWKAGVRTGHGNGPGVHKDAIPAAPSPAGDSHGDGCCCRSDANANTNTPDPAPREERSRVRRIRSAKATYNPNDNIRRHTTKRTSS